MLWKDLLLAAAAQTSGAAPASTPDRDFALPNSAFIEGRSGGTAQFLTVGGQVSEG